MKKICLILLFLIFMMNMGWAVTPNSGVAVQTPNASSVVFPYGSSPGTYSTVYTAAASGSIITGLWLSSNDIANSHAITCQKYNASYAQGGNTVNLPPDSGFYATAATATPPINMFSSGNWPGLPINSWGNPYMILPNGYTLKCTFATALQQGAVTGNIYIDVEGGGDF